MLFFQDKKIYIGLLIISFTCLFTIQFSFSIFGLILNPVLCLFYFFEEIKNKDRKKSKNQPLELVLSVLLMAILIYLFYIKWYESSTIISLISNLGLPTNIFVMFSAIVIGMLSFPAVLSVVRTTINKLNNSKASTDYSSISRKEKLFAVIICLISAFSVIGVCSKSSFIYPLNDWGDSNCYFTVGKSMMNGLVPYRDLFEHKGPLLYLLHGFAYLISNKSFFGVYILESICTTVFLYYSYKIARLYFDKRSIILIPILASICFTSQTFKDGDSAEEISLPFLVISLFIFIKTSTFEKTMPRKESFMIGILSGCVFWIKFSLVGMYLGWYFVYVIDRIINKRYKEILFTTLYIAFGVVAITLPFVIYFAINGALADWYIVYIYDNVFLYSNRSSNSLANILQGCGHFIEKNNTVFNLCLAGILFYALSKNKINAFYSFAMMFFTLSLVFMGGLYYRYYSFVMQFFAILGLIAFYKIFIIDFQNIICRYINSYLLILITIIISVSISFYLTPNKYLLGVEKKEMPQYYFAEIMEETKDATLLNYGFLDGGFYTASGIIPNCKAFCKTNMDLEEMINLQEYFIHNGLTDYIVSKEILNLDKYDLINEMSFPYNTTSQTFYLYKLKEKS